MTSPGVETCQACQHGQDRHDPEVPGCIECRCVAYVSAESVADEMRDRVEYWRNLCENWAHDYWQVVAERDAALALIGEASVDDGNTPPLGA